MTTPGDDKKQFTSEDIQRYISGEMSTAEGHALEKEALEDPFLADAIEGMQAAVTPLKNDFELLQNRLQTRIETKRTAIIAPFYKVAAAAIIFLLAGSMSIIYFLNKAKEAGPVTTASEIPVTNKQEEITDSSASFLQPSPDSLILTSPVAPDPIEQPVMAARSQGRAPAAPITSGKQPDIAEGETDAAKSELDDANKSRENISMIRKKPDTLRLAEVSVLSNQQPKAVASRGALPVEESVLGTEVRPNASVNQEIQGKAAGIDINSKKVSKRKSPVSIQPFSSDSTAFSPVVSWTSYAAELEPTLGSNRRTSEAVVQFRINPQGQPQDLRILRTQYRSKSAEIIRFIQNGPLWQVKPGADSTVKVLIRF